MNAADNQVFNLAGDTVRRFEVGASRHFDADPNLAVIFLGQKFGANEAADHQIESGSQ